jgi:hypothetical protein
MNSSVGWNSLSRPGKLSPEGDFFNASFSLSSYAPSSPPAASPRWSVAACITAPPGPARTRGGDR